MAINTDSASSSVPSTPMDNVAECCFLLKCGNKQKSLPNEFIFLLEHHKKCNITIVQSFKSWNLEVNNGSFASGWLEFTKDNLIHTNGKILLRHNGDLKFDLMLFTELKMNTKFPWTVPLSDILKLHVPGSNDKKAKYILYQHVCSSIKPNIVQDETDSIAFYQVYNKKNRDKFKIPKFLEHIVDSNKTPVVTLRTGYKAFQVGMQGRQFTSYWEIFVKTHELEVGETLVFIPESINSFTVQIYKPNGVEKLFPWYHKYYVYSYL